MKILMLTGKMENGGAETHVYELVRGLLKRGHSVTLASAGGRMARLLHAEGVRTLTLPLECKNPVALAYSIKAIDSAAREEQFDVLHSHTRISAALADIVGKHRNIPTLVTMHAKFDMHGIFSRASRWGEATVTVSYDLCAHLLNNTDRVLPDKVTVIPNGIDTNKFSPAPHTVDRHIVFVSRLDADCSDAAFALCRIAPYLQKTKITIAGSGSELERLQIYANKANKRAGYRQIRLVGHVENMPRLLRSADIFVGVSRAALEAMSCGVPTILAGNEGFIGRLDKASIRRAEYTNFCCRGEKALSDDALLGEILSVLDNGKEKNKQLGAFLREYVKAHHSIEHCAAQTENVYRSLKKTKNTDGGILLCGYYGYGNFGDDALLMSAVKRSQMRFPRSSVSALTKSGHSDSQKFGIRCVRRTSLPNVLRAIERSRAVIFGGGTLLQNSTSRHSLWYYLFLLHYAQARGKHTELWGNGIGTVSGTRAQKHTAMVLSKCDYVGLRDSASLRLANALLDKYALPKPPLRLERDLAYGGIEIDYGHVEYILSQAGLSGKKFIVAAPRGSEKTEYTVHFASKLSKLVKSGFCLAFIAMYPREDSALCHALQRKYGGIVLPRMSIANTVGVMKRAGLVCGMRYHSLVLADIAGTPFIGIGSERKIKAFEKQKH